MINMSLQVHAVVGVLSDDTDPMVTVMKLEKAPTESYADIGGLDTQIQEIKESVELPLTHPEYYEEMGIKPPKGVILYGPPGTGKSTMARVLARQCGYETQEVNASDVRTGDQLVGLIKNSLTTNAHFSKTGFVNAAKKKPVCLILDEIDGALGGGAD